MLSVTNCVASHKVCAIVNKEFEKMQKVKGGLLNGKEESRSNSMKDLKIVDIPGEI
jgi:hypothetical protein